MSKLKQKNYFTQCKNSIGILHSYLEGKYTIKVIVLTAVLEESNKYFVNAHRNIIEHKNFYIKLLITNYSEK